MAGGETMADGGAVVVADHVVAEGDITLPRETGRARRPGVQLLILQPAIRPMPMRAEHGGYLSTHIFRAIEIARDVEAWIALKVDLLDRVIAAIYLAEDRGIDRRLRRRRPQPGADQNLFLQPRRAIEPFFLDAISGKVVGQIEVSDFGQSRVVSRDFLRE